MHSFHSRAVNQSGLDGDEFGRTIVATHREEPAIRRDFATHTFATATYETEPRSAEEQQAWLRAIADHYPAVVAQIDGEIVGWTGAGPYRARECYRGIGEFSMYVRRDWRGQGVGDLLLAGLTSEAERLGLWKLLSRIFPFNEASRALCRKHGFREVGVYEKHARLDGRWLDVVIVERLIFTNLKTATF